jgi:hypothetical protein
MGGEHYVSGLLCGTPSSSCGWLLESHNPSGRHIIAAGLDAGVGLGAKQESESTDRLNTIRA